MNHTQTIEKIKARTLTVTQAIDNAIDELKRSGAFDAPECTHLAIKQLAATFRPKLTIRQAERLMSMANA